MDRLEDQGASIYTAPGLVPGLLGAIIALFGVLLARRALATGRGAATIPTDDDARSSPAGADAATSRRFAVALVLCLVYAIALVGHLPFWLATGVFVTAFIAFFEYPVRNSRGQVARGIGMALVYGTLTSAVVSLVFEQVFLVRLP